MEWRGIMQYIVTLIYLTVHMVTGVDDSEQKSAEKNETIAANLLNRLLNKSDSRIRPLIYGIPVGVQCDLYIASFGSINAADMDFQVDIYFRQTWTDPRLAFTEQEMPVILSPKLMDRIWVPDLFFPNEKSADIHDVMLSNQVMKIFPNGTVKYSSRLTLRLACPMVLTHFPMDYQNCYIKISSYSYSTADVVLTWEDAIPVELNLDELFLPQFTLLGTSTEECAAEYKTGSFSCLMAVFHLKRQFGYYLLQAYIPSILIVVISWISFWIHKDAVPARITLGVTTVLTMATQLQTARGQQVSYARALDVWYAFCMILVFSTLIEYAFVNSLARGEEARRIKRRNINGDEFELSNLQDDSPSKAMTSSTLGTTLSTHSPSKRCFTSDGLDSFSRFFFPSLFALFNIVYWIGYTQKVIFVDVE